MIIKDQVKIDISIQISKILNWYITNKVDTIANNPERIIGVKKFEILKLLCHFASTEKNKKRQARSVNGINIAL